jgi:hypothetical protein
MTMFTKTEALKRLRALAAEARLYERLPRTSPVEVGLRCDPVVTDDPFRDGVEWYGPDDDLADYRSFKEAAVDPSVAGHGAIVHIYLSEQRGFGVEDYSELRNVVMGWMGTPTEPAVLLSVPGRTIR